MNEQIRRLFFVFCALFVALIGMSSYWLWKAPDLEARQGNPTLVVRQLKIDRGRIYAADAKTVLARNRQKKVRGQTLYYRVYPQNRLTAHLVGYSTIERSRTGLEKSLNDYLTGSNSDLSTLVDRTLDTLKGLTRRGNDVVTSIDPPAQRVALNELAGKCGAAVALDVKTGRVMVMASTPTYDPNLIEAHYKQAIAAPPVCTDPAPLLNRATQGLPSPVFIPGSTFKIVTATAAIDSGVFTPDSTFDDPGYCEEYGKRVSNYADQDGAEQFGRVNFTTAVQHSINSVFCNIGKKLGPQKVLEYAKRYGFYERPPLETPDGERAPSGLWFHGRLFDPKDPNQIDPGRLAFGQERLLVTPLQMAMVAATVANGGILMEPHSVDRIVAPDGTVISKTGPREIRRVMKESTAAALVPMMEAVVEGGTGTAAQIPGVAVAGKTGTAETGRAGQNDTGFICFAPADNPRFAVAVYLQDQSGVGGTTAAPIAKAVLEALLRMNP
jgi:peptidoglycan glycosyltransferase